jgi:quercetin dioxygenase-like cupin family protein
MSEVTFVTWAELSQVDIVPGVRRRHLSGENVMLVEVTLANGAVVPEHQHPHEQISQVLSGKLELVVGGQKQVVGPGQAALIPSNVRHLATALEPTITLDIFSPPREDFLAKK